MEHYKQITLKNKKKWQNSLYFKFLQNADKKEFLNSQIPFYFAVEAFPRFLLKLAMLIETSEARLLLVNNIYEEHGNGDNKLFHTKTFKSHLEQIGFDGNFKKNPFIEEWISYIFQNDNFQDLDKLGSYLAGIEYMYALICPDIINFMDSFGIISAHYNKHSDIDWEHGQELLEVIQLADYKINDLYFEEGQLDFIELFSKMVVPTKKELIEISQIPVSFFYSREDSNIEKETLKTINFKNNINILMVCSGGEHIFELSNAANDKQNLFFDVIDANKYQIEVFQNKLLNKTQTIDGKFERLFKIFREIYFPNDYKNAPKNFILYGQHKLDYVLELIFTNENLNIVFGEEATKYSKQSFSEHFKNVFKKSLDNIEHNNIQNILYDKHFENKLLKKHKIKTLNLDIKDYFNNNMCFRHYDIVDLSNIGDWMSLEEYKLLLLKVQNYLGFEGKIIVRKLLGDYSLKEVLETTGFKNIQEKNDNTNFYTECYVAALV